MTMSSLTLDVQILSRLSAFAIAEIFQIDLQQVYVDISTMLRLTMEYQSVVNLATFYVFRVRKTHIEEEIRDSRVTYIVAFSLAMEHIDDFCNCRKASWPQLCNLSNREFWEAQRIVLRHLNYKWILDAKS